MCGGSVCGIAVDGKSDFFLKMVMGQYNSLSVNKKIKLLHGLFYLFIQKNHPTRTLATKSFSKFKWMNLELLETNGEDSKEIQSWFKC